MPIRTYTIATEGRIHYKAREKLSKDKSVEKDLLFIGEIHLDCCAGISLPGDSSQAQNDRPVFYSNNIRNK